MVPGLGKSLFSFMSTLPLIHLPSCLTRPTAPWHRVQLQTSPSLKAPHLLQNTTVRGGMANNLFPLIFHSTRKQVLPHAALGARHCTHPTLHLSSCSAKLPPAPACRFPPCGAQPRWNHLCELGETTQHRHNAHAGGGEQYAAGSSGLVPCYEAHAALCPRGRRSRQQRSSLPTSAQGAGVSHGGVGRTPPLHPRRIPIFHLPRGLLSLLQTGSTAARPSD